MTRRPSAARLAVTVPVGLVAVGLVAAGLLVPGAAGEIAVHWDLTGRPDGFASPLAVLAITGIGGLAVALLLATLVLVARSDPSAPARTEKLLVSVSTGLTALLSASGVWMLATQRGDAEPSAAGIPVPAIILAVVLAVAVWFVLPRSSAPRRTDPTSPSAVALTPTERVVWIGVARTPRLAVLAIGLGLLVVLGIVAAAVLADGGAAWPVLVVPAGAGLLVLGLSSYTVRVDGNGLTVRAVLGLPRWRVRPEDVATAGSVEVWPIPEFGGWGIRVGSGRRLGIIVRSGDALQVRRRDGRALVVTVDDADTAAALLTAVAERAATAPGT